ncbi:M48 family peptidase [Helicobacter didelphidarum]|uniref:M48 family peptidase n=1 Tax=Helicobacter didelphidarum TaxID=2040648 RepID=A0A3D8IEG1_9HELI|nr:SprT family zinc-dependent metalloprotease [Helicobacter didelphidarum]RDU63597.1 M48 family peptidase [Helicobacter didelphidarum]
MLEHLTIIKKDIKSISLKVRPNGEIILTTPKQMQEKYIKSILEKRAKWIEEKRAFFASYATTKREYVSGEDFYYRGRRYRIKLTQARKESIKLTSGYLELCVRDKNDFIHKEKMIYEWYHQKALLCFFQLIEQYKKMIDYKGNIHITIRKMKTRWGSCNASKSSISLNIELIKKPKECIEYVILHELTHLIHPNHSKDFYKFLSCYMSDWRERKERLNKPMG